MKLFRFFLYFALLVVSILVLLCAAGMLADTAIVSSSP